jgi:hypothetical protein
MTLPLRRPVLAVIMAMRLYQRLCETLPRQGKRILIAICAKGLA